MGDGSWEAEVERESQKVLVVGKDDARKTKGRVVEQGGLEGESLVILLCFSTKRSHLGDLLQARLPICILCRSSRR